MHVKTTKAGEKIKEALNEVINGKVKKYSYQVMVDNNKNEFKSSDLLQIRSELGMSRDEFANAFNLSKYSLRNWELGKRFPTGAALSLLKIIKSDPLGSYKKLHN